MERRGIAAVLFPFGLAQRELFLQQEEIHEALNIISTKQTSDMRISSQYTICYETLARGETNKVERGGWKWR